MADSAEERNGTGVEGDVKTVGSLPPHGEAKPTYRSFKYVIASFPQALWVFAKPTARPFLVLSAFCKLANTVLNRKKYRKMRIKFDEQMKLSNDLFTMEHNAKETARRLAQQNEYVPC